MKQLLQLKRTKLILLIFLIVLFLVLITTIICYQLFSIKKSPFTFNNIELNVYEETYLSEIINRKDIEIIENKKIDTLKIGKQDIDFIFLYKKDKYKGKVSINVIDNISPTIFASSSYTVVKGEEKDFINSILCGDNYDDTPIREIRGEYDLNKLGTYDLTYYAQDSSGNEATKDFKVKVVSKKSSSFKTTSTKIYFTDIIEKYKNDNTQIGIDVSKWQGNIDFEKVKQAGCEFVIIRLGHQNGLGGEMILDPYFKENIKKATKAGLKTGVYVYTYAKSQADALAQAKWAVENVGDYPLELGISYDWESWSLFNKLNLSYYNFTNLATTFLDYTKEKGYEGMLYSSKNYLENIWMTTNSNVWLAHYTTKTNYAGKYMMWQMTNQGRISGVNGEVDINILYKK